MRRRDFLKGFLALPAVAALRGALPKAPHPSIDELQMERQPVYFPFDVQSHFARSLADAMRLKRDTLSAETLRELTRATPRRTIGLPEKRV